MPNKESIPVEVWEREGLCDALIEFGFAEKRGHTIYVKGSESQFAWLIQCHENGKKGGRPPKSDQEPTENPWVSDSNQPKTPGLDPRTKIETSYSYSSSYSSSKLQKDSNESFSTVGKDPPMVEADFENFDADALKILEKVTQETVRRWFALYHGETEFIEREFIKAWEWIELNPKRKPTSRRGWSRFASTWLERSWPKYQKTIPANQKRKGIAEILKERGES